MSFHEVAITLIPETGKYTLKRRILQAIIYALVAQMVKNPPANAGDIRDVGSTPILGRSSGERNGYLFQYSHLENSMDRGAWWATVYGVTKSWR